MKRFDQWFHSVLFKAAIPSSFQDEKNLTMQKMDSYQRQTVIIVIGGAGGCCTALELAKTKQFNIHLFEKNKELMRESSDATPGRMGPGFHYADVDTASYYLHATLNFTKRFSRFHQEIEQKPSHPRRRGRYSL